MSEKVQTVLGPIAPSELGKTLTHEHLAMEFRHFYRAPPNLLMEKFNNVFSLERVGYLKQYPYSSESNLLLNDQESRKAVINDVREYKRCGGGTIVENTTEGIQRDVKFYKEISKDTGVHVVAGTGFYIADVQTSKCSGASSEDMYNHMLKEFTEGCVEDSSVKPGFIGEVASVWPVKDFERRAIIATGELGAQLGVGVSFHPHRESAAPRHILRLYLEAGGKAGKAVMSHLDRTLQKDDELLDFAELGSYCQFDLFGIEVSYYQLNVATDMPSDAQRLDKIKLLVDHGYEDRVLMSHDIHTKHRLIDFGGHGYSHILNNVLPRMEAKGFTPQLVHKITEQNPANWLSFKC